MSTLSANNKRILEKVFQMEEGYVLNFTNRTFSDFFETNYDINIYDDKFYGWSGSKASRMRSFWDLEDNDQVALLISDLLKYIGNEILLENLEMRDFPDRLVIKAGEIADELSEDASNSYDQEDAEFLNKEFSDMKKRIKNINEDTYQVIDQRIKEAQKCIENDCPLAAIFLIASTLEGILLEEAESNSQVIMSSDKVPRDKQDKIIQLDKWTLNNLIVVCTDVDMLSKNSSYYGGRLRGVRNFIHPREQLRQNFNPNLHLAKISLQVLRSCLDDINNFKKSNNENNTKK
jgi:hypothetical protein